MIDIHSHLIFDVDDGPSFIKDSIHMVIEAEKLGIESIIATPHFHDGLYEVKNVNKNFCELNARVSDCGVKLSLGYEVYLAPTTVNDIKQHGNLTLNGSKYLLFELPFNYVPDYCSEVLSTLIFQNYTPILAHPERHRSFIRDFNQFMGVVELGCLVQVDAASILGVYGSEQKNFVRNLIKLDMIHFIASDAHSVNDYIQRFIPAYQQIKRWTDTEYADRLFHHNPKMVLDGN